MAAERTFAMLKPGVLSRRVVGEIISKIERKGFKIIGLKMMNVTIELAERQYAEHKGKSFYLDLLEYIASGPVVVMVLEADQAIELFRLLCGFTSPEQALPGTIRGDYAMHTSINIIHASDSKESAVREIDLFFRPEELIDWEDGNQKWI